MDKQKLQQIYKEFIETESQIKQIKERFCKEIKEKINSQCLEEFGEEPNGFWFPGAEEGEIGELPNPEYGVFEVFVWFDNKPNELLYIELDKK